MAPATAPVRIGTSGLTIDEVVRVARDQAPVELTDEAEQALATARGIIDRLGALDRPVYGVSTGFGALARVHIPAADRERLQHSLVRSHAAGTGPPVEDEVVRAMAVLRLRTLAMGRSGVRPELARLMAAVLSAGLLPRVPEFGSLGCSGDLAPLAHLALVLMGEGTVHGRDGEQDATAALHEHGLRPLRLTSKEGLALINGTDGMLGMLCLSVADLEVLLRTADIAAAMSVEALLATDRVFAADLVGLRPHPGQAAAAAGMRLVLRDSPIMSSHRGDATHVVQDAYSLRCAPQVAGAARDTLAHARLVAERELAAIIDNPVVMPDERVESNGNFHGAPVGYVLDFLAIATADVASIAERRVDRMLDETRSHGLPAFLAHEPGVDSGLMIAHYTAAGIVSEMKRWAVPASVDSIPSSAMQEDHVSMGWSAGRALRRSVDGLARVLAVEVLTATRALDLRHPLQPAPGTGAVRDLVRRHVPAVGPDRVVAEEIDAVADLVRAGAVVQAAEAACGRLP